MFPVLCGVIGSVVGTFLAMLAERLPSSRPVLSPLGCPSCGRRFAPVDLIPVLGHVVVGGRCRSCGFPLARRLPIVQATTALLFAAFGYHYGVEPPLVFALIHLCFLIVIFFVDLDHQLILNRVVFPAMGAALLAAVWLPSPTVRSALLGGAAGFTIFFAIVFIYPAGMGMGDARLAGYLGLVLGLTQVFLSLVLSVIMAGIAAIILLAAGAKKRKDSIPFGPFLVVGGLVIMLWGEHFLRWVLG